MWTKSACVVLAWGSILMIVVVVTGMSQPVRRAQANIRTASSTTEVTDVGTVSVAAVFVTAARPDAGYAVQPGDTLSGIAARLAVRGGWPALYAANRSRIGPDPGVIRPGTVLAIPRQAAAPRALVPSPGQRLYPPPASAGSGKRPVPGRTGAPTAAGMPQWLKIMLLGAGLAIGTAFLAESALLIRRRRRRAAARAAGSPGPAREPALVPSQVPHQRRGSAGHATVARIVLADYDRVVVTYSEGDGTVYVLRPPGEAPGAILRAARLVLPEVLYGQLAVQLGMPVSWPIVLADHDRLIVMHNEADGTVYVLRPPGEDPRRILRAARLVLPEDPYQELADQLGVSAGLPMG